MNPDPLAQLRDIHLPAPIGWWPPAPGWWILALVLLVAVVIATGHLLRRRRQLYFRRQARDLLTRCWDTYQLQNDDRQFVEGLFTLIRRACLSSNHGGDVVGGRNRPGDDPNSEATKVSPDSLTQEQQAHQLKAISSAQVFNMLDRSVGGDLAKHLSLAEIEALLYRPNPAPLKTGQTAQLYAAARRYLKRGVQRC